MTDAHDVEPIEVDWPGPDDGVIRTVTVYPRPDESIEQATERAREIARTEALNNPR
ncbi:hypothetical protein [Embleya sp. NPDC005575]|uniref:hypothetical protein n=1 Tax=Embleya sp. NPDC005575 TaxID=3156892 RepID=UPI0033A3D815